MATYKWRNTIQENDQLWQQQQQRQQQQQQQQQQQRQQQQQQQQQQQRQQQQQQKPEQQQQRRIKNIDTFLYQVSGKWENDVLKIVWGVNEMREEALSIEIRCYLCIT